MTGVPLHTWFSGATVEPGALLTNALPGQLLLFHVPPCCHLNGLPPNMLPLESQQTLFGRPCGSVQLAAPTEQGGSLWEDRQAHMLIKLY